MSFRARLALASAAAVAIAVAVASFGAYVLVRDQLVGELDRSLRAQVPPSRAGGPDEVREIRGRLGGPGAYVQLVDERGNTYRPREAATALPVTDTTERVLAGDGREEAFEDAEVDGVPLRIYTARVRDGLVVQLARPRDEVDSVLGRLRNALVVLGLGGVALAGLLGLLVSRTAIGPLTRLADAAEGVAATGDLSRRVGIEGQDEVGRLGSRFDGMLAALEGSEQARRMLVADASHELRTPLTSVRTNVEIVRRHPDLPADQRDAAIDTALAELDELSALVTDVVELARGGELAERAREAFRLDELVADAVERAQRAAPSLTYRLTAEPVLVDGVRERAFRAVANLLDNARKWSPPGGAVEVTVAADGWLTVRDHGPGFVPEDLPHVFDRFYRSTNARGMQGSGLGLAIVSQVAEMHGGAVLAANAPEGGAVVRLRLGEPLDDGAPTTGPAL